MSKYLITGVMGFVGRYFVEYLQLKIDTIAAIETLICRDQISVLSKRSRP